MVLIKDKKMYYVYKLMDPRSQQPFYIGKGKGKRAQSHLTKSKFKRVSDKIKSIRNDGYEPYVEIYSDHDNEQEAYDQERLLIQYHGRKGYDQDGILMNICEDNRPPKKVSQTKETRAKISAGMIGKNVGKVPWNKGKEHKRGPQTPDQSNKVMKTKLLKLINIIFESYELIDNSVIAECRTKNIIPKNSPISERVLEQYLSQSIIYKECIHRFSYSLPQ